MRPFSDTSLTVLCKRYLRTVSDGRKVCKRCGKSHETIEELFKRCSFGRDDFYELLLSRDFLPNSPTLFNAGTGQGTFSGCFKFDVQDSMEGIMSVAYKSAFVQKWGGGVGYCLSSLRPYGSPIRTTHGRACGPIAVLELYHAVAEMITQGGKRSGAQMGILHCDHPDIVKFIHCKDGGKNLSTFNISVACTNEFMRAVQKGITPQGELFEQMVESAWKTGDPGIYFIDNAEAANPTPWLGRLTGTNPCGEVPLLDNEPCNLGSINLSHMVKDDFIDMEKLEQTTRLATRYLDTVLDNNVFPDEAIANVAKLTRKLGLGVMGWADALAMLRIHYDSDEAVELGAHTMEHINTWAHDESRKLADEKGNCPAFVSRVEELRNTNTSILWRRNATVTCIAPAGTISTIADCSSGIEPHYTLKGVRVMGDGTKLVEEVRVDTADFIPRTAHEIDATWHVKHQGAFQLHTDLAVSKTVNLPTSATREQIREVFMQSWLLGCKGVTVYRDKSRDVQVITEDKPKQYDTYTTDSAHGAQRRKMPKDAMAYRHSFSVGGMEGYMHIGLLEDGKPGELFITGSNQGSTVSGLLASLSIMTSLALQYGVPLATMVSKLQNIRFEPAGLTDDPEMPTATSVVAYIYRYFGKKCLGDGSKPVASATGMLCPDCGAPAISEGACLKCSGVCGWSVC